MAGNRGLTLVLTLDGVARNSTDRQAAWHSPNVTFTRSRSTTWSGCVCVSERRSSAKQASIRGSEPPALCPTT
jgi:hypothetical protein